MTTLVFATDPHLSDKAPASRTDDWLSTVIGKFDQVGQICREVNADASIWGGDIFHLPEPSRTSHRLVNRLAQSLSLYPCERYCNVGNHDCKYRDYKHLPDQPLETLFVSQVFKRLYDEHEADVWSGDPNDSTVRVVGIPFHGYKYDLDRFRIKKGDEDYLVAVAHVLASPKKASMFDNEDVIQYSQLLELAPDVDVWCFGHWHKDQGEVEIAPGKWVVNPGSLTRGALSIDELDRVPKCVVLRFEPDGITVEPRPLDVKPASEIFNLEKRVAIEAREATMSQFVDKLNTMVKERRDGDFEDSIETLRKQDESAVTAEVSNRARTYIEEARAELAGTV